MDYGYNFHKANARLLHGDRAGATDSLTCVAYANKTEVAAASQQLLTREAAIQAD